MAKRPLFNSPSCIVVNSLASAGFKPNGSKPRSPG
eukprot:CAMPEP_0196134906 /NCGR_PEP_ID=MMETSP0910-20130528/3710_1 /TAXON_ID=49265 /ORGANISM="Thalassiosira rotula, Strain GSO102" /LENGTH=34 /DNA_ID= /DNA_START= /DNA_END= /DNA_ORIENTATION=